MGAVATLLYAQQHHQHPSSAAHTLRHSMVRSPSQPAWTRPSLVKAIVLDSPFHNFKDIAREIASKKMGLPHFILDVALSYVEESFGRLLEGSIGAKYNPFNINFKE
jgi:hypothetical protein